MILQNVPEPSRWLLATAVVVLILFNLAQKRYRTGLRSIPGPSLARYSSAFRILLVYKGDAPSRYRQLHEKYGTIVRTGPNHVSVSDPAMIPVIYGIGQKFNKVCKSDFD